MRKLVWAFLLVFPAAGLAEDKVVALPAPQTDGGKPLMQLLKARQSAREFDTAKLPLPVLSNLLWAASGINRADGRRTAPTAANFQEIDIYAATADGLFLYVPKGHQLQTVLTEDIRALAGTQDYVKTAPLDLIYVADIAKIKRSADEQAMYSAADTGFIGQNVYLFCTSEGLATVIRALIDRPALAKAMHLRPEQKIILSQSVGYPKK
jgi:nitroreductase